MRKLYLEPSSRCNLNCEICFRHSWGDEAFGDMDQGTFQTLMDTMPPTVETVFFGGMGEPLVHPELLGMVAQASARAPRVELLTNATLLGRDLSRRLIEAGLDMLWISADSFSPRDPAGREPNHSFARIRGNIRGFNQERLKAGRDIGLGLNFVVSKSNADQLPLLPSFARRYRIGEVNVSNVIAHNQKAEREILYDKVLNHNLGGVFDPEAPVIKLPFMNWRQKEAVDGVKGVLASSGIDICLGGHPFTRKARHCRFIDEDTAFVRQDGQVSPCMALLHNGQAYWNGRRRAVHHHSFGRVGPRGLGEIWNSSEYAEFRERVRAFDFSPCIQCTGCDLSEENITDCYGSPQPTCGACLWAEGIISCP